MLRVRPSSNSSESTHSGRLSIPTKVCPRAEAASERFLFHVAFCVCRTGTEYHREAGRIAMLSPPIAPGLLPASVLVATVDLADAEVEAREEESPAKSRVHLQSLPDLNVGIPRAAMIQFCSAGGCSPLASPPPARSSGRARRPAEPTRSSVAPATGRSSPAPRTSTKPGDAGHTAIALFAASQAQLYVRFDDATGVRIWRTANAFATSLFDLTGPADCVAGSSGRTSPASCRDAHFEGTRPSSFARPERRQAMR